MTDELIWVGLGSLQLLQVKLNIDTKLLTMHLQLVSCVYL